MGRSDVQAAAEKIVAILEREDIPYAVIGALALNEYGHRRVTIDVEQIRPPRRFAGDPSRCSRSNAGSSSS